VIRGDFDILQGSTWAQPSYQPGRLATALGYLGLVGELDRVQIYPLVLAIWAVQLVLSPWWLQRYYYGPLEWLWRGLTYGKMPALRR